MPPPPGCDEPKKPGLDRVKNMTDNVIYSEPYCYPCTECDKGSRFAET